MNTTFQNISYNHLHIKPHLFYGKLQEGLSIKDSKGNTLCHSWKYS
jgi:hypothetical protein